MSKLSKQKRQKPIWIQNSELQENNTPKIGVFAVINILYNIYQQNPSFIIIDNEGDVIWEHKCKSFNSFVELWYDDNYCWKGNWENYPCDYINI